MCAQKSEADIMQGLGGIRVNKTEPGEISPVSFKRKLLRDLVLAKDGPVWRPVCDDLGIDQDQDTYDIMERKSALR